MSGNDLQPGEMDRVAATDPVSLSEQARILELTHDTVIIRSADGVILYWNDGAEDLYGYSRDEALGMDCSTLLECSFPSEKVKQALLEHGRWSGEISRRRRDGDRVTLASRWLERRDPAGAGIGIIEVSADMSEHRRSELEREKIEQRYSAIFHAAGFAIWESDWSHIRRFLMDQVPHPVDDLRSWLEDHPDIVREAAQRALIREVNQSALDLFAAGDRKDLVGSSIIGRYPSGGEHGFATILAGMAQGLDVVEAETRLSSLKGRTLDVVLRATMVPDGEPWSRVLVMAFDETERKEARAKLEQSAAELAHAARISVLGQLGASIAHEVNQPLTAILTYGKSGKRWLGRETPDIDEALQCLNEIVSNAQRAADIITRVRSLARKAPPQSEEIGVSQLMEEALSLVRREASASQVAMESALDPSLPLVNGDRVQVQQVVVNLLMNAIQAMEEVNDRPRKLFVRAGVVEGAMVRVAIEDNGCGLAGDDPSIIFTPFFTTKGDGMGMGLSICRSIIEAQGGRIMAESNPQHGLTIAFTLPSGRRVE